MSEEFENSTSEILEFLQRKNVDNPQTFLVQLNDIGKQKLCRLVNGDIISDATTFAIEFELFLNKVNAWNIGESIEDSKSHKRKACNNEKISLFWNQFTAELKEKIMVVRKQHSGLCYLHAPIVLEHYLIAIATSGLKTSMIDIGIYEANLLEGHKLEQFILTDDGGDSQEVLFNICDLKLDDVDRVSIPKPSNPAFLSTCDYVLEKVSTMPALVSSFRVYADFTVAEVSSFDGIPVGELEGRHSMVLIGARKTNDNKYFFLLQNWWSTKFFVEVSDSYMYYCGATITFVDKAVTRRPNIITLQASYAETCIDNAESLPERLSM